MLNKRILVLIFLLVFLPLVGCFPGPSNETPIITSVPITTATVGEAYTYDVNATDPDDDTLTYSLTVKPTGMIINSATGLIEWTPAAEGDYDVVVKVSDGTLDITQSFTIVVIEEEGPGWTPTPTPPEVKLTSIVVVPKTMTLFVGEKKGLKSITAHYNDGSTAAIPVLTMQGGTPACEYKSDDELVATVTITGLIEAVGEGTATITVTYQGKTDKLLVTVKPVLLTSIVVLPETMIFTFPPTTTHPIASRTISVTAYYNNGSDDEVDFVECVHTIDIPNIVTVDANTGLVTAIAEGIATITVSYTEDSITETGTVEVTVSVANIIIDGVLSFGEWFGATEILIEGSKASIVSMGTVRILATTDYLYVAYELVDSTDVRLGDGSGNDKIGLNINPTGDAPPLGFPYDILFQTGADPAAWGGISSGLTDDYETQWLVEGTQYDIPDDLETKTIFNGKRISEWKVPLDSMALSSGDVIKVGGATDIEKTSYRYPVGLEWAVPLTYADIIVH